MPHCQIWDALHLQGAEGQSPWEVSRCNRRWITQGLYPYMKFYILTSNKFHLHVPLVNHRFVFLILYLIFLTHPCFFLVFCCPCSISVRIRVSSSSLKVSFWLSSFSCCVFWNYDSWPKTKAKICSSWNKTLLISWDVICYFILFYSLVLWLQSMTCSCFYKQAAYWSVSEEPDRKVLEFKVNVKHRIFI